MNSYELIVKPLTEISTSSKGSPLNNFYLDIQDDIVVCNNMINKRLSSGYVVPKIMDETTRALFPHTKRTAHYEKEPDTSLENWKRRTLKELDYCCSNVISYTWQWDIMVNRCIDINAITPAVYNFIYLVMKAMARSPPLPIGTKLYRGSKTSFTEYQDTMGLLSFTTDLNVATDFAGDGGYVGIYTVPEGDYIHGLWFSSENGTSIFHESEVLLGPGVCIVKPDNFEQKIINQKTCTFSQIEIKQLDIGTYFTDNFKPFGDIMFKQNIESILTKAVCFNTGAFELGQGVVILPKAIADEFGIVESGAIHYSDKVLSKTILAPLYIATQKTWVNIVDITPGYGVIMNFNDGMKNYQLEVYKILIDDLYIGYYTFLGILQLASSIQYKKSMTTLPFDEIPEVEQLIINHSDNYMNRIECYDGKI